MTRARRLYTLRILLCAAVSASIGGCAARNAAERSDAPPVVLDGDIGAAEWAGAERMRHPDGGELLVLRRAGNMSIAYRGERQKIATVCVASGSRVRVLHASAALGEALYERESDGGWRLTRTFDRWTRPTEGADALGADVLEAHVWKHGWAATTLAMEERAPARFEMTFDVGALPEESRFTIALLDFFDPERPCPPVWPAGVADDAGNVALQRGDPPERATFDVTRWAPSAAGS